MPGAAEGCVGDHRSHLHEDLRALWTGEPCCRYMGPDGAGHYVKMVHNGIEYGDMQLICEAYAILTACWACSRRNCTTCSPVEQGRPGQFPHRDHHAASSPGKDDDENGTGNGYLVDKILDKAGQKGTGKWTIMSALDLGVVVSTINAAVEARVTSSMKDQRVAASKILHGPAEAGVYGRQKGVDRRRARCALCFEDHLLRTGDGPARGGGPTE